MDSCVFPAWARSNTEKRRLFGLAAGFGASELILSDEDAVLGFLTAHVTISTMKGMHFEVGMLDSNKLLTNAPEHETQSPTIGSITSVLQVEFCRVFGQVVCNDQAAWNRLQSLASKHQDPLAQAILAIGFDEGWFFKDFTMSNENGNHCFGWLQSQLQDQHAHYCLGQFYALGIVVEADITAAVRYFRLSAEAGCELAQFSLGWCYEDGEGVTQDVKEAIRWYRLSANQGYCEAQNNLGYCYEHGEGVTKNLREAIKWYQLAADQGYCTAQFNLGCCLEKGEGVTVDLEEAVRWFRLAADKGDTDSQFKLGQCYQLGQGVVVDLYEAMRWYLLAADDGDSDAQYTLGQLYHDATADVEVEGDECQCVRWYRLAADQGNAEAQCRLGYHYETECESKDFVEAVHWYMLAADQGNADAQSRLDVCRQHGIGIAKCINGRRM